MGNVQSEVQLHTKHRLKVALTGGTAVILLSYLAYHRYSKRKIFPSNEINNDCEHEYRTYEEKLNCDSSYDCSQASKDKQIDIKLKFNCIPSEYSDRQSDITIESIINDKGTGDRRHKIVTNKVINSRSIPDIMQCIGRVVWTREAIDMNKLEIDQQVTVTASTGTVFKSMKDSFLVITCAHSICGKTMEEKQHAENVYFLRNETYEDINTVPVTKQIYKMKTKSFKTLEYKFEDHSVNDVAVLEFEGDITGFYKGYTEKICLLSADKLPKKQMLTYNIYGYPCPKSKHAMARGVKDGELWGMRAKSFVAKCAHAQNISPALSQQYVKRDGEYFCYNAIDTEPGQSGSAIFVCLKKGVYAIVGVHTNGAKPNQYPKNNIGVALNESKIKSLLKPWNVNEKSGLTFSF
eukprot:502656_1